MAEFQGPNARAADTKTVTAMGQAAIYQGDKSHARDKAIEDAMRKAVEMAVGAMVSSETITENFELIDWICFIGHTHQPGVITPDMKFLMPDDFGGAYTFDTEEYEYNYVLDGSTALHCADTGTMYFWLDPSTIARLPDGNYTFVFSVYLLSGDTSTA